MSKSKYVIVRCEKMGCWAGEFVSRIGTEVVLKNARRLWYWNGASSLSQLAMEGTSKPNDCKFPCAVDEVELLDAGEILSVTAKARNSIESVKVWEV